MSREHELLGTLISIVLSSMIVGSQFITSVEANPIPFPILLMPEEYINVTISLVGENLVAKVEGIYPFSNLEYEAVEMDYPLPPNATNISVKMDEALLDWTHNNKNYSTVIGDWPMINWTISPLSLWENFTIITHYEHPIPIINGNYTFLYAMGTGRYLDTYAKKTTAHINIHLETNYTNLHVYTIGFTNGTWTWNPANHTITTENTSDIITLEVVSRPFAPLVEDLLVTIIPEFPSLIILPLFMTITLIVAMVYRKHSRRKVTNF